MGLKSNFDQVVGRALPPRVFFALSDALRNLLSSARRGGLKRRVRAFGGVWLVQWEDGASFAFVHSSRYHRYQWPDGLAHIQRLMLDKYQDREVVILPGDVVIEAGANVGEFALAAAGIADEVISFEPDPVAYRCLERNVQHLPNVTPLRMALGNEVGSICFYLSTEGADSSVIEPETWSEKIWSPCSTVSDIVIKRGGHKIGFLKVEAEGFEPEVLQGAESILSKVRCVAIDCSPERGGESPADLCEEILRRSGFRTWRRDLPDQIPMLFGFNDRF